MLRAKSLQNGPVRSERPGVVLLFFDQNRKPIGTAHLAPPIADEGWSRRSRTIPVPIQAREAILAVTLAGGTGELAVDGVSLNAIAR